MYREYVKEYLYVNLRNVERASYPSLIACKFQQYLTDMAAWIYDSVVTSIEEDWEKKGFDAINGMGLYKMTLKVGDEEMTITNERELFRAIRRAAWIGIEDHLEYEASYYCNAAGITWPVFEDGTGAFCPANRYFETLLDDPDCAKHMTFRSICQGEELDDIGLVSSPAGSDKTIYGDSILQDGMEAVESIEAWRADMINFSIHFPEDTQEELTQRILTQLRELGKKFFTTYDSKSGERRPFDVNDEVETYKGEYEIVFARGRCFTREELAVFCGEVEAIAQLVLEAKGRVEVKGWLLSNDEKNMYSVAYMQLDQAGKMTFSSAKL